MGPTDPIVVGNDLGRSCGRHGSLQQTVYVVATNDPASSAKGATRTIHILQEHDERLQQYRDILQELAEILKEHRDILL